MQGSVKNEREKMDSAWRVASSKSDTDQNHHVTSASAQHLAIDSILEKSLLPMELLASALMMTSVLHGDIIRKC